MTNIPELIIPSSEVENYLEELLRWCFHTGDIVQELKHQLTQNLFFLKKPHQITQILL